MYLSIPVYLPDGFAICDNDTVTAVITWLVPITDAEAGYVRTRGWSAFEEGLVAEDPDLVDLSRNPVITASDSGGQQTDRA